MTHTPRAVIDFESRSACSLKACGAWRYSLDPTTEVMCLVYRLPYWDAGVTRLWHPAYPSLGIEATPPAELTELFTWIDLGGLIEAHNAAFERSMWVNVCVPRLGWPPVPLDQWRCSAAKCAACALPRKLEDAADALKLDERKDDVGAKVMKKVSKPRKPRKAEREAWALHHGTDPMPLLWWESVVWFEALWAYCRQDVITEEAVSQALPDLSDEEQALYTLDQRINQRGFQLDMGAVDAALVLLEVEEARLNAELATLTNGHVQRATQRAQLLKWLKTYEDLGLPDSTAATIDDTLDNHNLSPKAHRVLTILRALGRASTAKYGTMRDWADPRDGRVRGGLLFHGATTGRWSAAGVQPHNFIKGVL